MNRLGFTMHPTIHKDDERDHSVLVTRRPERVNVASDYKQAHEGCPFNTELRPTSFADGSDAYHAPPTSDELLIEIATYQPNHGVREYIGFLAPLTEDTPSTRVREVKWIPRDHDQPIAERVAARDLGPSRHGLLSNVYDAVDRWSMTEDSPRDLGVLANNVLGDYLGTMCHDINELYDAVNCEDGPDVQPPSATYGQGKPRHRALIDHIEEECVQGRKAWYGRGQAEDRYR